MAATRSAGLQELFVSRSGLKSPARPEGLVEDGGAIVVHEGASLEVIPDGTCEDDLFEVLPFSPEVLDVVFVRHLNGVLFDDGPRVELFRRIMARGTNHLDPPVRGRRNRAWLRGTQAGKNGEC